MHAEHNIIDLAMDVPKEFLKMPIFYIACHHFVTEVSSVVGNKDKANIF